MTFPKKSWCGREGNFLFLLRKYGTNRNESWIFRATTWSQLRQVVEVSLLSHDKGDLRFWMKVFFPSLFIQHSLYFQPIMIMLLNALLKRCYLRPFYKICWPEWLSVALYNFCGIPPLFQFLYDQCWTVLSWPAWLSGCDFADRYRSKCFCNCVRKQPFTCWFIHHAQTWPRRWDSHINASKS